MDKNKKGDEDISVVLNGRASGVAITLGAPEPSGGMEKFNQYIKEKSFHLYNESGDHLKGEVSLSFSISKKGRPQNIKVLKSPCAACADEAIRLLQLGPAWIGRENEQGTVIIKF
ncbi:MAG: hypothetical protein ABIN97_01150 [Ginsengibacter sp.]